jgi:hypothetical protein
MHLKLHPEMQLSDVRTCTPIGRMCIIMRGVLQASHPYHCMCSYYNIVLCTFGELSKIRLIVILVSRIWCWV